MKSLVAIGMLVLALSLCNLMGRRSANNSNRNTNTENTSTQNSNAPSEPPPPPGTKPTAPRAPISGGVLNDKAIKLIQPPYPQIAKAAHASGQVTVQVLVDEEGNVISAHAVSGHPLLQPAAIAAARQSKFTPMKLAGQPVKVTGMVVYNFVEQ